MVKIKTYRKSQFLQEVRKEIENIKQFATDEEKERLDLATFNPDHMNYCIYGQLCGDCRNKRAVALIRKCARRYIAGSWNVDTFQALKPSSINGMRMPQQFATLETVLCASALEVYITLNEAKAKHKAIFDYLSGKKKQLVL